MEPTKASGSALTYSEAGLFLFDTVPDMSDQWCTAYFKRFKLQIGNILKETCSLPDGDGHDVEPELIKKSCRQKLIDRIGAAHDSSISLPCRLFCGREGCFNAVCNEDVCGAPLHSNRVSLLIRQDKDRCMVDGIVSPPALPVRVLSLFFWAIHVAAYNEGTCIRQCISFSLVFFWLIEHPVVEQIFRNVPKWVFKTLVGSGNESI